MACNYSVEKELGRGSFGVVHLVRRRSDGAMLARKSIRQQSAAERAQVLQEIDLLQRLRHAGVVGYVGAYESPGEVHVLMAYLPGGTLTTYVRSTEPTPSFVLRTARCLLEALAYVHAHRVIHRDIKPDNILLAVDGRPVLADFGVSKANLTALGASTAIGTLVFMAPEVLRHERYHAVADVWSLGATLFFVASRGRLLVSSPAEAMAVIEAGPRWRPPPLPGAMAAGSQLLARMLVVAPDRRDSAASLLRSLPGQPPGPAADPVSPSPVAPKLAPALSPAASPVSPSPGAPKPAPASSLFAYLMPAYLSPAARVWATRMGGRDFDHDGIRADDARAVAEALRANSTLVSLRMQDSTIGADVARTLAEVLTANTSLHGLYLNRNCVGDAGVCALAGALRVNKTLQALYLAHNAVGDDGARALAEGLKANTALVNLDLGHNSVGDDGARVLADTLRANKTLRWLILRNNSVGVAGARALADALRVNSALVNLDLQQNAVGDEGARALAAALTANTTLHTLYLQNNSIGLFAARALGTDGARALRAAVASRPDFKLFL